MKCTWESCEHPASKPQIGDNGAQWANLCDQHAARLDQATASGWPALVGAWIKAQGGSKAAAKRMNQ